MLNLEETKRICEAATPGPWSVGTFVAKFEIFDRYRSEIHNGTRNRDFIAHARTALPEAVAEIERLRARVAELEARQ